MRLHKLFLLFVGILLASNASGVDIKPTATKAEDFVPEGWKLHSIAYGDLNRDGKEDVALVIQETNEKKIIHFNNGYGDEKLDSNPRALLIAFKKGNAYELVLKNEIVLPRNDAGRYEYESPCYEDHLQKGKIEITTRNILKIFFYYPNLCYAWEMNDSYTFRYQNNRFELIGLDSSRGGDILNINFSREKFSSRSEDPSVSSFTTGHIKTKQIYDLQTMSFERLHSLLEEVTLVEDHAARQYVK